MPNEKNNPNPDGPFMGRGREVWEWVKQAGIAKEGEQIQRVVIDIDIHDAVKVYVEKLATRRMLMVEPLDFSRNIVAVDKPEDDGGDASAVA